MQIDLALLAQHENGARSELLGNRADPEYVLRRRRYAEFDTGQADSSAVDQLSASNDAHDDCRDLVDLPLPFQVAVKFISIRGGLGRSPDDERDDRYESREAHRVKVARCPTFHKGGFRVNWPTWEGVCFCSRRRFPTSPQDRRCGAKEAQSEPHREAYAVAKLWGPNLPPESGQLARLWGKTQRCSIAQRPPTVGSVVERLVTHCRCHPLVAL